MQGRKLVRVGAPWQRSHHSLGLSCGGSADHHNTHQVQTPEVELLGACEVVCQLLGCGGAGACPSSLSYTQDTKLPVHLWANGDFDSDNKPIKYVTNLLILLGTGSCGLFQMNFNMCLDTKRPNV